MRPAAACGDRLRVPAAGRPGPALLAAGRRDARGRWCRVRGPDVRGAPGVAGVAAMAEFQAKKKDALMCLIGDEDTVTGFLLAGVGEIDTKKNSNFLVVNSSACGIAGRGGAREGRAECARASKEGV